MNYRHIRQLTVLGSDRMTPVERQVHALFSDRISALGRLKSAWWQPETVPSGSTIQAAGPDLVMGIAGRGDRAEASCRQHGLATPKAAESFTIQTGRTTGNPICLYARDENGLMAGAGHLLRQCRFAEGRLTIPAIRTTQSPAIAYRGMYFATHFNNYYERAPLVDIDAYIGELALWGINRLMVWFDMNWFQWGFWQDETSRGMRMLLRLRRFLETARQCGMKVGACGVPNEGFSGQVPPRLLADPSAQRGGFYVDTQICPSKPGGLKMILENRRRVLDLLGPIDFYMQGSYDQGGCGCSRCTKGEYGWVQTSLKLAELISGMVKKNNPKAEFIVSNWLLNEKERNRVYALCRQRAPWIDGVLQDCRVPLNEMRIPSSYSKLVFPEISMFGCFFASYGCNGANPAPVMFTKAAQTIASAGYGMMPYSEGLYEDINKIIWASILWNPKRTAREVVEEYCRYYFGHDNEKARADLVMALENTWGPVKLGETKPGHTARLSRQAAALAVGLPVWRASRLRWKLIVDRTRMDDLMVQIGPDTPLLRQFRILFDRAPYADCHELRRKGRKLLQDLHHRQRLIERLFDVHVRYLRSIHTEETCLVFRPDELVGDRNWATLIKPLEQALTVTSEADFRRTLIGALRRWFWFSGIEAKHMFL